MHEENLSSSIQIYVILSGVAFLFWRPPGFGIVSDWRRNCSGYWLVHKCHGCQRRLGESASGLCTLKSNDENDVLSARNHLCRYSYMFEFPLLPILRFSKSIFFPTNYWVNSRHVCTYLNVFFMLVNVTDIVTKFQNSYFFLLQRTFWTSRLLTPAALQALIIVKGRFRDVEAKIIFFEFTFKLKINIHKNLLVNFTV